MPPFLTEEELNQLLSMQTTSKTSYYQNIFVHSPANPAYHKSKNKLVDQFRDEQTSNPICLIGEIIYVDDSLDFDQSDDDDVLQTKANLAEPSTVDLWDEVHYHQIESIRQDRSPMTLMRKSLRI